MMPRKTKVSVAAFESPKLVAPGWSPLAIPAQKTFKTSKLRPAGWRGGVYGMVVHTTGRGLPTKAKKAKQYPTVRAVNYYATSRGCHYVNGYRGHMGGDLLQMASEDEQAWGVSSHEQRDSYKRGWEGDLPKSLVKRWKERWPGYSHPLDLLPGSRTVNSCYLHVECIPLLGASLEHVKAFGGSLFTDEQHRTVAALAVDVAERNKWRGAWWRTARLVGHEDLTPITRHNRAGGWDPGYLRAAPYFSWNLVVDYIGDLLGVTMTGADHTKAPKG